MCKLQFVADGERCSDFNLIVGGIRLSKGNIKNNGFSGAVILVLDIFVVAVCGMGILRLFGADMETETYYGIVNMLSVFAVCNVISSAFLNLYSISFKSSSEIAACEIIANVVSSVMTVLYAFIVKTDAFADLNMRYILLLSAVSVSAAMVLWRVMLNGVLTRCRKKTSLLVIEPKREDIELAKKIKYANPSWFDSWYVSLNPDDSGNVDEIVKNEYPKYDGVLITQKVPENVKKRLIAEAIKQEKNLYVIPTLYEINITKYRLTQFDDTLAFLIKPFSLTVYQRAVKRFFDIVLSVIGIIMASPIMLVSAAAIKLDSKGKVIYSQERVTYNKKKFNIYKFRTMVENAEQLSGPKLASENDDRITTVGRILRKYRIDELPQLFNILMGDMSIVGPRPERSVFVDRFCEEYSDYDKRFIVKAGLTGYAQTYGKYDTDVRDKLIYDLLYIREYSFVLDLKIIFLTVKTVFMNGS